LHNSTKATHIVILEGAAYSPRTEGPRFIIRFDEMKKKMRSFAGAQGDKFAKPTGNAKASLARRALHNSTKATHIVILKKRRIRRELKDLDFSYISMKRRKRRDSSRSLP
jgi:hypothetical protein